MPKDPRPETRKPDPVSLATWARLASAGAGPLGGKPNGAEIYDRDAKKPKKKKKRSKK